MQKGHGARDSVRSLHDPTTTVHAALRAVWAMSWQARQRLAAVPPCVYIKKSSLNKLERVKMYGITEQDIEEISLFKTSFFNMQNH